MLPPRIALIAALARMALREVCQRWQQKLALWAGALVLGLIAVVCLLVAAGIWLAHLTSPLAAALIMAAAAALLALVLGLLARRRPPPSRAAAAMEAEIVGGISRMVGKTRKDAAKVLPGVALGGAALAGLLVALRLFRRK